jgi:uncharacterized membrane protein YdbT with pleckstrin-like domain
MDEIPTTHPGVPQDTYHALGKKTLWIFIFQRIQASMVLLLITIVLFVVSLQTSLTKTALGNLAHDAGLGALGCLLLFVIVFAIGFLAAWLTYKNFKFSLGDDSLKIKRGILNKEEVAIPYRQIQDVDIQRDFSFQMMGLSRIMILTAGHEDEKPSEDDSEGILPALDKDLAEWLQAELLKRANIQKVTEDTEKAA